MVDHWPRHRLLGHAVRCSSDANKNAAPLSGSIETLEDRARPEQREGSGPIGDAQEPRPPRSKFRRQAQIAEEPWHRRDLKFERRGAARETSRRARVRSGERRRY
ncbi:hypothetical protein MTO96_006888 [Rhipicephalus appendiculatus]